MSTIAKLNVMFTTDVKGLTRGLREASARTKGFSKTARKHASNVSRTFGQVSRSVFSLNAAVATLAGGAGFGLLIQSQMRAIQTTERLTRVSGFQSRTIEALGVQGRRYNISQERTNDALVDFSERLGEARQGTGEAVDGFKQLEQVTGRNINLGQNVNAVWREFVSAMGEVGDASTRASIAAQVGGDALRDILPVISQGADGFQGAANEVERLNLAMNQTETAKVVAANAAVSQLQDAFAGAGRTVAVELAPYMSALSGLITDNIVESENLGASVVNTAQSGGNAIAKMADVLRGVRVATKAVTLGFQGIGTVAMNIATTILEGWNRIWEMLSNGLSWAIDAANSLGANIDPGPVDSLSQSFRSNADALKSWRQEMNRSVGQTASELHDLAMQPMPSHGIDQFFQEIKRRAANFEAPEVDLMGGGAGGVENAAAEAQRRETLQQRLEDLKTHLRTEEEQERFSYRRRLEDLKELREQGMVQSQTYLNMREQLEAKHHDRLNKIRSKGWNKAQKLEFEALEAKQKGWRASASFVTSQLQSMTNGIAQHSRAAFEINKAASIAQALLKVPEAAANAYAWGSAFGGPPAGAAAAAVATAAQLAQVAAIKSTSFSGTGGGNAPSVSGTTPADPVTPVSDQQQSQEGGGGDRRIYVEFEGEDDDRVSLRQMRRSIRRLREENPDADLVF